MVDWKRSIDWKRNIPLLGHFETDFGTWCYYLYTFPVHKRDEAGHMVGSTTNC